MFPRFTPYHQITENFQLLLAITLEIIKMLKYLNKKSSAMKKLKSIIDWFKFANFKMKLCHTKAYFPTGGAVTLVC